MKKNFSKLSAIALIALLLFASSVFAAPSQKSEVKIKTSAFSWMCKNKIESKLKSLKGVDEAFLSMKDKVVTVTIENDKINKEELTKNIKNLGYDAEFLTEHALNDETPTEQTPSATDTKKN